MTQYCNYIDVTNLIAEREWKSTEDECFLICNTIDQCKTCKHSQIIGLMMKDEVKHFQLHYNKKTKVLKLYGINTLNYLMNDLSKQVKKILLFNQVVNNYKGCSTQVNQPECDLNIGSAKNISICK